MDLKPGIADVCFDVLLCAAVLGDAPQRGVLVLDAGDNHSGCMASRIVLGRSLKRRWICRDLSGLLVLDFDLPLRPAASGRRVTIADGRFRSHRKAEHGAAY